MGSLTSRIKERAFEVGFHKVGIVPAVPLDPEGKRLNEWLAVGYHGGMLWMARDPEKRADPRQILPDAKSVIVTALNYFTPHQHRNGHGKGKISRYAWGDDYHDIVKQKLYALLDWIKKEVPEPRVKVCVDTAPMMDKAWAVRAGLGWLGKHSNLITKEYGSWVFIGEILLDLELEYDTETVEDHCGSCTACIDACPTQAIVEPFVVDSRRCLSYATIELRDSEIPPEIAANMNGWLYGCDICQDVCPWNRFETPTEEKRFVPRNDETSMELYEVLSFTPEKYAERFRNSAMKRAKLSGLKRNAKVLNYPL